MSTMTRAVPLAFLTLCFTKVSLVTAGAPLKATCAAGQVTLTKVSAVGQILVECPKDYDLGVLLPDVSQATVYMTSGLEDNNVQPISHVCPGAELSAKGSAYEVRIPQLPNSPKTFYLRCTPKNGSGPHCLVGLEIAPYNRLGPNTCAAKGTRVNFIVEKNGETVNFACGEGKALHPTDKSKAYNDACTEEVSLPAGAALTQKGNSYQLTVQTLPTDATNICYVCSHNKANAQERCEVHVAIRGAKSSGALSAGGAARAAAALGVSLLAAGVLRD